MYIGFKCSIWWGGGDGAGVVGCGVEVGGEPGEDGGGGSGGSAVAEGAVATGGGGPGGRGQQAADHHPHQAVHHTAVPVRLQAGNHSKIDR